MGISFTNTEEFDVISLSDSALSVVSETVVHEYSLTRDMSALPLDRLMDAADKPVVFTVEPLKVIFEGVTDGMSTIEARAVFQNHVKAVKNVPLEHRRFDERTRQLTKESVNSYPIELVKEIAEVIVEAQSRVPGGDVPFTPTSWATRLTRNTLSERRTRLAQLHESVSAGDVKASD